MKCLHTDFLMRLICCLLLFISHFAYTIWFLCWKEKKSHSVLPPFFSFFFFVSKSVTGVNQRNLSNTFKIGLRASSHFIVICKLLDRNARAPVRVRDLHPIALTYSCLVLSSQSTPNVQFTCIFSMCLYTLSTYKITKFTIKIGLEK